MASKYTFVEPPSTCTKLPDLISSSSTSSPLLRPTSRFQCVVVQIVILTLLTFAIFGFRCFMFVPACRNCPRPFSSSFFSNVSSSASVSSAAVVTPTTTVSRGRDDDDDAPPRMRRFPDAIIFGVRKSGTRALLTFLGAHPAVRRAGKEIHFFDAHYGLGADWYRQQMPLATRDELVVEKTPGYFIDPLAPARVKATLGSKVKLILIVKDPVERTVSDYVQLKIKYEKRVLKNNNNVNDYEDDSRLPTTSFERKVLTNDRSHINTSYKPVRIGQYDVHFQKWNDVFPPEQILVVDGEAFVDDPFDTLVQVEAFLGLEHKLTRDRFVLNEESGFYCLRRETLNETRNTIGVNDQGCLSKSKGRPHPAISPQLRRKLTLYFRSHVEKFFELIGRRFDDWPTAQNDSLD